LLGQSFILLLPLPLFFSITGVAEVVGNLILQSEPLHVLTLCGKVLRFALFNKSCPVFFCHIFVLTEGGVLDPPNLHKLTLVARPSMRDDLHSYLLPLLLQLFRILNVCLNRVFEEFILFIFRAARPQTLDNLVFTIVSKRTPSSFTSPTLITSVGHVVCDLGCR
jgi:hypothetical protein